MSSTSNNSKYTAKMTAAYTQFSGGMTNKSMNTNVEADEIAQKIMHDKDFRLVEFLKYDSGLGREQNIEMGNASSLAAQENIYVKGGVTLSCFAPVKYISG